jgi:hypothetical protein
MLRWPRDKRETYKGLWHVAEDSGCLEDDPFNWKLLLWPSPLDSDITVDLIEQWRDDFLEAGKLVPYRVGERRFFFIRTFHDHEHPRNPQFPDLPLPPWVTVRVHQKDTRKCQYVVSKTGVPSPDSPCTTVIQEPYKSPSPVQPSPALKPSSSETPVSAAPRTPAPRLAGPKDADYETRADAALAKSSFPSDLRRLAELLAADNKTNTVSLKRVVDELYEPLVEMQAEFSPQAMRHGLRAAITACAPNKTYVRKAAAGYRGNGSTPLSGGGRSELTQADKDFFTHRHDEDEESM